MSTPAMYWNNETKRLEFADGTPVGSVALNEALQARGKPRMKKHLQETPQCVQRREEETRTAIRFSRHCGTKFQRANENFVKPGQPSHGLGPPVPGRGYRAGILDTMD